MAAGRREQGRASRLPAPALDKNSYGRLSTRPLHVLVFLAPLVLMYELGLALVLRGEGGGGGSEIAAHQTLAKFFQHFGATGLYLPGVTLLVVLVVWHVISRDRWRVKPLVPLGMLGESVVWTLPLLVLGLLIVSEVERGTGRTATAAWGAGALGAGGGGSLPDWRAAVALSIGAGLYEELLFRLLLLTALHAALFDVLKLKPRAADILAVVGAAVAFALYHPLGRWGDRAAVGFIFYTVAGAYFGAVFLMRGFGVVVGTHAMYDIMMLVVVPRIGTVN